MGSSNVDLLILILSIGFIILIVFICVALGAMIKIMLDVRKVTDLAKKQAENVASTMDSLGDRAKSFLTNSFIMDKIIPAVLGAITVGMAAKKTADKYKSNTKEKKRPPTGDHPKGDKKRAGIFSEEEID